MDDLLFSLNTVLPLLVMMAAGYLARALRWVNEAAVRQLNACVFKFFLPLLLCFNILDTKLGASVDTRAILFTVLSSLLCFLILFVTIPRVCHDPRDRGVMIQGIARSNYAIFGIPLVNMMYPNADTSIMVLIIVAIVPVFNILSTVALIRYGGRRSGPGAVLRGIALNPLILGTALGFALWLLHVTLPAPLETPLRKLAGVASPLSLFLLGASLDFSKARANARLLIISVLGRLVAVPAVFLSLGIALGIRNVSLAALIAVFASPTSVSSFPMAQQMGGNGDLAGGQVVFSTVFSILTVFLWVFALKSLGFLG